MTSAENRSLRISIPEKFLVEAQQLFEQISEQEHKFDCTWDQNRPQPRRCPQCFFGVAANRISDRKFA